MTHPATAVLQRRDQWVIDDHQWWLDPGDPMQAERDRDAADRYEQAMWRRGEL